MVRMLLLVFGAPVAALGCQGGEKVSGATGGSSAAALSAARPPPPPAKPASDTLRERPDLLLDVPEAWMERIKAHLRGETDADACPALAEVKAADEFERREAVAKAMATCKPENEKALAFVEQCPVRWRFRVSLGEYDFEKKVFHAEDQSQFRVMVTEAGRVVPYDRNWLLAWNGVYAEHRSGSLGDMPLPCGGPADDVQKTLAKFHVDLSIDEAAAKGLRGKVADGFATIEAAFVLDGGLGRDELVCRYLADRVPTGRVLAWRLVTPDQAATPLLGWISLQGWEPPSSCDDAKSFFGVKAAVQPAATAAPSASARVRAPLK